MFFLPPGRELICRWPRIFKLLTDFCSVRPNSQMGENVMKSTQTQAWGWLVAGVLALGLNGIYQDGGGAWLHRNVDHVIARVADRSGAVLALASGRADLFLAKAKLVAARNETASCRMATAMARMESKLTRGQGGMADFEAMSAREEEAMARLEANRARMEAQVATVRFLPVAFGGVKVVCPRVRVQVPQVSIPEIPAVRVTVPDVHVDVTGAEPI
jgi:hypothetical protein